MHKRQSLQKDLPSVLHYFYGTHRNIPLLVHRCVFGIATQRLPSPCIFCSPFVFSLILVVIFPCYLAFCFVLQNSVIFQVSLFIEIENFTFHSNNVGTTNKFYLMGVLKVFIKKLRIFFIRLSNSEASKITCKSQLHQTLLTNHTVITTGIF